MDTRRDFLKKTVLIPAAGIITPLLYECRKGGRLENFGFITGIIGKELQGDWKTVLKTAASYGYSEIETGDFLGDSPESFLSFLNETGLKPVAGGINFNSSDEEMYKSFEMLNKLKIKIAVSYWPWFTGGPFSLDDCRKSADRLNELGKKCKDNGFSFCWHNHDKEFIPMENGLPFDFLMNNTDSSYVKCELDVYWAAKGGADPVELLRKYKGRYLILHIKDMAPGEEKDFECPGSGIIDFRPVFREAYAQNIKHFMVERDKVTDGLACLKTASEYLKKVVF